MDMYEQLSEMHVFIAYKAAVLMGMQVHSRTVLFPSQNVVFCILFFFIIIFFIVI